MHTNLIKIANKNIKPAHIAIIRISIAMTAAAVTPPLLCGFLKLDEALLGPLMGSFSSGSSEIIHTNLGYALVNGWIYVYWNKWWMSFNKMAK